ncbi:MAG TPA: poly-gamma-glutamate synthase PgsB [Firmicutes bacterium]|nr:poly-gamma-glutamate synthase PgsB [Bacillota bacterium]
MGLSLGLAEKLFLKHNLSGLKNRIIVNGTRGKSTVTRLLTAAFLEAGIRTVGKTTGSEARIISFRQKAGKLEWFEQEMLRPPEGANIKEARRLVRLAGEMKAKALITECLAVEPGLQDVFARQYICANVTVITNVLRDHMEVLGPGLEDTAEAFAATIPRKGLVVTLSGPFTDFFREEAIKKGSRLEIARKEELPAGFSNNFSYPVFPDALAIALKTALCLGIKKDVALKGILKAPADPGTLSLMKLVGEEKGNRVENPFIKAFAANDPASALAAWDYYAAFGLDLKDGVIILNCRKDRVERTKDFVRFVLPRLGGEYLVLTGAGGKPLLKNNKALPFKEILDWENLPGTTVLSRLKQLAGKGRVFLGLGNYCGPARELCLALEDEQERWNHPCR